MNHYIKTFLAAFLGCCLAALIWASFHLYQDHLLVDAIRNDIMKNQAQKAPSPAPSPEAKK